MLQSQLLNPLYRLGGCRLRMTLVDWRQVFQSFKPMGLKASLPLVETGPVQTSPTAGLSYVTQFTRQLQNAESMLGQLAPRIPLPGCFLPEISLLP